MQQPKNSIQFIVNPISGGLDKSEVVQLIETYIDSNKYDYEVLWTKYSGHGFKLARKAVEKGVDIVCAVGGDGSVHNIASGMVNSDSILAIIPIGSGNGLARHLQIPMNIKEAISTINQMKIRAIDVVKINRKYFFNVAGFGFDGHISKLFAKTKKRGLANYTNLVLKEFFKAQEDDFSLLFENKKSLNGKALMLSIANGAEFGNGFQVSPKSSLSDGYLELVVTRKPGALTFPSLVMNALKGNAHTSKFVTTYRFKKLTVLKASNSFHADGEPISVKFPLQIEVNPKALLIIAGENYI